MEQIGKVTVNCVKMEHIDASAYRKGESEDISYDRFGINRDFAPTDDGEKSYLFSTEEYHLSRVQHNLLKWFPFDRDGNALEVGSGDSGLTGLLCDMVKKVTVIVHNHERALAIAHKHCECSNLEVIVSNLRDYESEEKFQYVTVIGVLEYARTFYQSKMPYESFLSKVSSLLKPNGTLILAIENKIGLKYVAGAPEDHTGRVFDSIYNYPPPSKVQTFSKKELTGLLNTVGFHSLQWYYPFPDYKMPQELLSEEITPGELDSVWSLLSATRDCRHKKFLSAKTLGKTLARAGLFGEFANSFLVIARREDATENFQCLRFMGANMRRKSRFRTNKRICRKGPEKLFIRSADDSDATGFIYEILRRDMLAKEYFGGKAEVVCGELSGNSLIYPYIEIPTLVELMAKRIDDGDREFGKSWIDEYRRFLLGLPTKRCVPKEFMKELGIARREVPKPLPCFCCGVIDCIPHNIMVDEQHNKWYITDNEWTFDFPVPVDFVVFRALYSLVAELQTHIQLQVDQTQPVVRFSGYGLNSHYIPVSWLDILATIQIPLKQLVRWSFAFQKMVLLHPPRRPHLRLSAKSRTLKSVTISEIASCKTTELFFRILRKARQLF